MPPTTTSQRIRPVRAVLFELRDLFVSLRLTMVLLLFSMVLIFAATLDQVNLGIWAVQAKYFRAFVVYTQVGPFSVPAFPGGYTIGGLLLLNLVAAHLYRFAFSWRKAGLQLVHFGLIVLLVGELLTGLWQEDSHLTLNEGESKNYAESFRDFELVLIDSSDPNFDQVIAVPDTLLAGRKPIQHPALPFRITTKVFYPNSSLVTRPADAAALSGDHATSGVGGHITAVPQPVTYAPNERNLPAAIVELVGTGGALGRWLVSTELAMPQEFQHENRTWRIALRVRRLYQPVSLQLINFTHDRYPGTEIPKNFSSQVRLVSPDGRDDREVVISMNNPLRHAGVTFYQAGFRDDDRTTILQVVRNPAWSLPYVACSLMTLGLVMQFGTHLVGFVRRRQAGARPARPDRDLTAGIPAIPVIPSRATANRGTR
jgi:hypothetical protein